jgi:hypothetical protein
MGAAPCNRAIDGYDPDLCAAPRDAAQTRIDHANSEKLVGFIGIGAGAALAATGLVLLFTGESPHRFDAPKQPSAGPKGPSFALLPGPGQVGLAFGGAF